MVAWFSFGHHAGTQKMFYNGRMKQMQFFETLMPGWDSRNWKYLQVEQREGPLKK